MNLNIMHTQTTKGIRYLQYPFLFELTFLENTTFKKNEILVLEEEDEIESKNKNI